MNPPLFVPPFQSQIIDLVRCHLISICFSRFEVRKMAWKNTIEAWETHKVLEGNMNCLKETLFTLSRNCIDKN